MFVGVGIILSLTEPYHQYYVTMFVSACRYDSSFGDRHSSKYSSLSFIYFVQMQITCFKPISQTVLSRCRPLIVHKFRRYEQNPKKIFQTNFRFALSRNFRRFFKHSYMCLLELCWLNACIQNLTKCLCLKPFSFHSDVQIFGKRFDFTGNRKQFQTNRDLTSVLH